MRPRSPKQLHNKRLFLFWDYLHIATFDLPQLWPAWLFRGQQDAIWKLTPKIDRGPFSNFRGMAGSKRHQHETRVLETFRNWARPYIKAEPRNDWEWLALAQHYGLATRLLDWTANPLAALFFAIEGSSNGNNSAVWCYAHNGKSAQLNSDPFKIKGIVHFEPPHMSERIPAQAGSFTVHPNRATWRGTLIKLVIDQKSRTVFRDQLADLNINRATLFPGLDGTADMVNASFSHLDEV